MAAEGARSLEELATWDVSLLCFVIISVSHVIEQNIHIAGKVPNVHLR